MDIAPARRVTVIAAVLALLASSAVRPEPANGALPDTLRVVALVEPRSLDPLLGTTLPEAEVAGLVFDGLIRINDRGRPVPDLATVVPSKANGGISSDGKTLTYHLVENARWHDGVPVTAADVIFTYRAIMNPANDVLTRAGYDRIAEISAPDPHTVRIRLNGVYAPAVYLFNDSVDGAILPKHLLANERDLKKSAFSEHPIGSGPYRFRSWSRGDRLIFEANPGYFRGAPRLKVVQVRIVPDLNTLLTQLRTGEADFSSDLDPGQLATARDAGLATHVVTSDGFRHLEFNTRRPPLNDVLVRRALCEAIDPREWFHSLFFGLGAQAPADQNPSSGWADPTVGYYPKDLAAAGRLLDSAGWKLGSTGIREKDGVPLSLTVTTIAGAKSNEQVEVALQDAWRKLGVNVTIKNEPGSMLFAPASANGPLYAGRYEVGLFSWFRSPDPDDNFMLGPDQLPPNGSNTTFYRNQELGVLQRQGVATLDERRRHEIYNKIQRIIVRDVPLYTLLWVPVIAAYDHTLEGVAVSPTGLAFWNINHWRYAPRR